MANKDGWWTLKIESEDVELSDNDREHIANLILEGCTSGEIIADEPEDEEDEDE